MRKQSVLTDLVNFEPQNASEKFCKKIYDFMHDYEDKIGDNIPYFICSNDLLTKYVGFMQMCNELQCYPTMEFMGECTNFIMQSYEPGETTKGLYHSQPKSLFESLIVAMKQFSTDFLSTT